MDSGSPLSTEQVLALAPDPSSIKSGQSLANPRKWASLGRSGRSVWGECQGSGKDPYRTQADLTGPACNCSCPSRKFPCKHGIGLLLILAANAANVPESAPPAWVEEWIAKRDNSAAKKVAKASEEAAPPDPETAAKRQKEAEKRAGKREDRVRAGLEDLQTWLSDLIRQGLAHAKQQPNQYWDGMAARMVDAQAPGIARRLRQMPEVFASGEDWAGRALERIGKLQWLLHGHANAGLSEGLRSSVRSAIGFTTTEHELSTAAPLSDHWQIVGQRTEEEDRLRVQRTWLVGQSTNRRALHLSFAAFNQPLDVSLVAGTTIDADLAFHPSGAPLRAAVVSRRGMQPPAPFSRASANFGEALKETAVFLAGDPWLEATPWFVTDCTPFWSEDGFFLVDAAQAAIPVSRRFTQTWPLVALAGGRPLMVFGEWNGHELLVLSAIADGRFVSLGGIAP